MSHVTSTISPFTVFSAPCALRTGIAIVATNANPSTAEITRFITTAPPPAWPESYHCNTSGARLLIAADLLGSDHQLAVFFRHHADDFNVLLRHELDQILVLVVGHGAGDLIDLAVG